MLRKLKPLGIETSIFYSYSILRMLWFYICG